MWRRVALWFTRTCWFSMSRAKPRTLLNPFVHFVRVFDFGTLSNSDCWNVFSHRRVLSTSGFIVCSCLHIVHPCGAHEPGTGTPNRTSRCSVFLRLWSRTRVCVWHVWLLMISMRHIAFVFRDVLSICLGAWIGSEHGLSGSICSCGGVLTRDVGEIVAMLGRLAGNLLPTEDSGCDNVVHEKQCE